MCIRDSFSTALNDALCMQSNIYKQMSDRGWYSTEQAQPQKLQQVKQKYATVG